jgi:hypothetical protein
MEILSVRHCPVYEAGFYGLAGTRATRPLIGVPPGARHDPAEQESHLTGDSTTRSSRTHPCVNPKVKWFENLF